MNPSRCPRLLVAAAVFGAAAVGAPAASAAPNGATVTGDDGNPVAIGPGTTISNMDVKVGVTFPAGDIGGAKIQVTGPDGGAASSSALCRDATSNSPAMVDFRGSGNYTVTVTPFADKLCSKGQAAPQVYTYTVAAALGIGAPPRPVIVRRARFDFKSVTVNLPVSVPPGAITKDIKYAINGTVNPDGSVGGPVVKDGFVDPATGTFPLSLLEPGTYTVVGRAMGSSAAVGGPFGTPWSAPVSFQVKEPFDLLSNRLTWIDSRGPSYKVRARMPAAFAKGGKVKIRIGRGSKGKYRSYGSAKIRSNGSFDKRFRLSRPGSYRMKISYGGNRLVAAGWLVQKFRISRRTYYR